MRKFGTLNSQDIRDDEEVDSSELIIVVINRKMYNYFKICITARVIRIFENDLEINIVLLNEALHFEPLI